MWRMWEEALGRALLPLPAVSAHLPGLCFHICQQRLELLAAGGTWVFEELLHSVPGVAGGCPCSCFHPRAASLGTAPGCGSCKDGSASPFAADPIRLQSEHTAFYLSFPTQVIPEDLSLPNLGLMHPLPCSGAGLLHSR